MTSIVELEVGVVRPEDEAALADLFVRAEHRCHCRYWHFQGTSDEWLGRCFQTPEENRTEFAEALNSGSREALGVLAQRDGRALGWAKVAPAALVGKLYAQRAYRGLECFQGERRGVYALSCMLVDRACRRQGIAAQLVAGAVAAARTVGASAIEAFPYTGGTPREDQLWMGPEASFVQHGFTRVADRDPYPVLRREL